MSDFDFDELDKAVSETVRGNSTFQTDQDQTGDDFAASTSYNSSPAVQRTDVGIGARPHRARFEAAPVARRVVSTDNFTDVNTHTHTNTHTNANVAANTEPIANMKKSNNNTSGVAASTVNNNKTVAGANSSSGATGNVSGAGRFMDFVRSSPEVHSRAQNISNNNKHHQHTKIPRQPYSLAGDSKSKFRPPVSKTSKKQHYEMADTIAPDQTTTSTTSVFDSPIESPFLPDAKVEKRPLGGSLDNSAHNTSANTNTNTNTNADSSANINTDASANASDINPATKITSTAPSAMTDLLEMSKDPLLDEPDELRIEGPDEPRLSEHSEDSTNSINDNATNAISGNVYIKDGAIPQQYKENPISTSSAQPGSVYDTEAYHQPLPSAEKSHSGVWIILGILLLVAVGAAIGAAGYFFILPLI